MNSFFKPVKSSSEAMEMQPELAVMLNLGGSKRMYDEGSGLCSNGLKICFARFPCSTHFYDYFAECEIGV